MWAAVLLWRERQIRLAHLRPTFPVRAFEAPGALGSERPTDFQRRSDSAAGWEYAEAAGRALGIRRLLGYDAQQASAPFLDQSNLNLAYAYAEQPLVHEARPSVAPRNVAAVSLVRPAPFEPALELGGFAVSAQEDEVLFVRLPDGGQAAVALAETTPRTLTVGGLAFEGAGLRYARLQPDHGDLCGLGALQVGGVAEFSEPATFRLTRAADGTAGVMTSTGVALAADWLGGPARRIEARGLAGDWADVTGQCGATTIPAGVVRAWAQRNERTLVEFRLSR